ncbi:MAG: EF-hand domain-containing protein [Prochlorotrichaceae cyanobacterium]|jgi:Ca2+-binding EF-hand superfamily protein
MLSDLQTQKIIKFFSMYDTNCDGFLVSEDFQNIVKKLADLKNLGIRSGKYIALKDRFSRAWKALEAHADLNHDHKISLKEWLSYYQTVLADEAKYQEELHTLMDLVFEVFDENGDGKICQAEWEHLFSIYNICPIYASDIFQKLDKNQDGFLDRSEVMDLIYHFFYSNDPQDLANRMFGPY